LLYLLPETLRTPIAFVFVLSVLVFIHELGHYVAARCCGVHVEIFSIGFGSALWRRTDKRGTVWKIAWIPLGGYVKMHGQEQPQDVSAEERASWRIDRTFHHKTVGRRAIVVAAGPLANFLLAVVLFAGLFLTIGRPAVLPVVGGVVVGSAAERAGLHTEDRILAVDDHAVASFADIQRIISGKPGERIMLRIARADRELEMAATLDRRGEGTEAVGVLGISGNRSVFEPVSPWDAVIGGFTQTWRISGETLAGVGQMLSGQRGMADLGGPLRIAQMSGEVAQYGPGSLVSFIAVISINLGLINLFPIPVLDGGHLMFYLAEAVRGRPLPPLALEYCVRAGIALLIGLFVFATWNDFTHFGWLGWVAKLFG
jgi:regulator of sigma E protease